MARVLRVKMGNATARDKTRIQGEGESEGAATIDAPSATDVGFPLNLFSVNIHVQ